MVSIIRRHINRFPDYIINGLLIQKILQLLKLAGFVIEPYYLVQEGLFGVVDFETEKNYNNFEFTELGLQDMPALDRFDGRSIRKETLQKRIKQGHKCFALKTDGSIAAFTWCNPNEIHHYKLSSRTLKQREAYLYDAQTHYNFRGRNLAPYLRYKSYYALNLMGFDILYSCSDYFNRPAIRFKQKLNARFLSIGMNLNLIGLYKKSWVIKQLADVEIMDNKV